MLPQLVTTTCTFTNYVITVPERHGQTDRQTTYTVLWHHRALRSIAR